MKRAAPVLLRLFLLFSLAGGAYYAYTNLINPTQAKTIEKIGIQVKGVAESFNIDTDKILSQAEKKLIDSQPIINQDTTSEEGEVQGKSTSLTETITEQAQELISAAAAKVSEEVKDLPKEQAANLTRQVCEQILSELE